MSLLTRSRLFGILLIAAALPMDPGVGLAASAALGPSPAPTGSMEARLQRIAAAVRAQQAQGDEVAGVGKDAISFVVIGPGGVGWGNGGFRNGGFYNGGFNNGGFYNGGFRNGGFYNGGFRNGGFNNYW